MTSSSYFLFEHVFICLSGDHIVLLDLKKHRYRAFEAKGIEGLDTLVPGWPVPPSSHTSDRLIDHDNLKEFAQSLMREGVLTFEREGGKDATPIRLKTINKHLFSDDFQSKKPIGLFTFVAMLRAFVMARLGKRYCSLEKLVRLVKKRNSRLKRNAEDVNLGTVRELMHAYTRLRPFFLSTKKACFFEALLLLNFFSYHGIQADWIFGVRMKPWLAHCWLQIDDVVLNDTLENVKIFTPIMVV